jgi:hypothetical protein
VVEVPPNEDGRRRYAATITSGGTLAGAGEVLAAIQVVGFAIAFALFFLGSLQSVFAVGFASLCLSGVLGVGRLVSRTLTRQMRAMIGVEKNALVMTDDASRERRIPLPTLRRGRVLRGARVVLRGRWGQRIAMQLADAADARSLLRDVGLSARQRPATFAFFFGLRVTVGADGILFAWPLLRRSRFVPYSKIVSMTPSPGMIIFRLSDGGRYEIMTTTSRRSRTLEQHDALVERIEDACSAYRADNDEPPLAALVRGGRSALGWVKDLRALGNASGSGYRAATLPSDALWRVALDPTASAEMRIGAGLALRGGLDEEGRTKLREAAEASASPKVRVVLEAAADGVEDEQLGEAIGEARQRSSLLR